MEHVSSPLLLSGVEDSKTFFIWQILNKCFQPVEINKPNETSPYPRLEKNINIMLNISGIVV